MPQGWNINPTTDIITFNEPPPGGTNNITVTEYAAGAVGGTDCFALGAWSGEYGWPTEVEFFSDRLWWAGTIKDPQLIWGSQTGDYSNHGKSTPIVDSDAVSFAINSRQVNAVLDLIPLDQMLILAKGGEFLMTGGQDDVITPSSIGVKPQSFRGSGDCPSCVVGDTAIVVQDQGSKILDMGYRFEASGYRPQEISVWADHLIEGFTMMRMEWMPAPWSVVWFRRDDNTVIGCSYMPEHEVIGWHTTATDGDILDIMCLPGKKQTEVHIVTRRYDIDGDYEVYFETMAESFNKDPLDDFYVDCGLTYDGRNQTDTTLTISGGTEWTEDETLLLTASDPLFVGAGDVGDGFSFTKVIAGEIVNLRVIIVNYLTTTTVEVESVGDVPVQFRDVALVDWTFMRNEMRGLDHLAGRNVAILADGSVIADGLIEPFFPVVFDGTYWKVTLPNPGGVVSIGLPYVGMIETLEINVPPPGIRDAKKLLHSVGVLLKSSRGVRVGSDPRYLDEIPQREFENYAEPTGKLTGYGRANVTANWGENAGKIYLVADYPLPCEVLSFIPKFMSGETI
jgi:hypothetical protein